MKSRDHSRVYLTSELNQTQRERTRDWCLFLIPAAFCFFFEEQADQRRSDSVMRSDEKARGHTHVTVAISVSEST